MKKLLSIVALSAIITSISCKKNNVEPDVTNVSTAYKVFLIEYTSTGCGPCGTYGYPAFKETYEKYPNEVTGIKISTGWSGSVAGVSEISSFHGFSGTPDAAVNEGKSMYPNAKTFANFAINARGVKAKAGVGISKTISGNTVEIKTKTVFFEDVSGDYNLALYVVENGIMATQSGISGGPVAHNNVLRGLPNGAFGVNIASSPSQGTVIDGTYSYTVKGSIKNPDNIQVVAVIWKMAAGKPSGMLNSTKN